MSSQRRLVHFSGSVQGVGFRFTARRLAQQFDVAGYVKNLPDGRVEIIVEGPPGQIDAFLRTIHEQMGNYIRNTEQQIATPTDQFTGFEIRF
ncbi:MAG: acylphosphatase [Phycisphaerae bacterium]|nr:acylphosphatase [Phycisphaerae bacterium]